MWNFDFLESHSDHLYVQIQTSPVFPSACTLIPADVSGAGSSVVSLPRQMLQHQRAPLTFLLTAHFYCNTLDRDFRHALEWWIVGTKTQSSPSTRPVLFPQNTGDAACSARAHRQARTGRKSENSSRSKNCSGRSSWKAELFLITPDHFNIFIHSVCFYVQIIRSDQHCNKPQKYNVYFYQICN